MFDFDRRKAIHYAMVGNFGLALVLAMLLWWWKPNVSATFAEGFPSDLVHVRNLDDAPLDDVVLVIDGRFRTVRAHLPVGTTGFELRREFEDDRGNAPEKGYRPQRLRVVHGGGVAEVEIRASGKR